MNHNHPTKKQKEKPRFTCGKDCKCCFASMLEVTCGCEMEAKQYEYNLEGKLMHAEHDVPTEKSYYTCPMHSQVRQDKPGRCPACAMELIPASAEVSTDAKALADKSAGKHEKKAENHAGHDMGKMSHADHEAAMTNPQIAKAMEADMRRRFWVSFILSIPIFLLSPVGANVFKIHLADPAIINWILFALTTPIVFWTGSIFITGTYYSLKARKLNMAVLIATGVLAAYLFSVL